MNQHEHLSVKDWVITFLILCIPFVNIIMPFVWAFGSNVPLCKQNYFKAVLLMYAIILGLSILFGFLGGFAALSLLS